MATVTRFGLLAAGAAVLAVSACSSGPTTPAPSPAPTSTTPSAAPSATPTPSASTCPDGAYRVTALEGRGSASALGKGSGGNIDASFSGGNFTLSSDGAEPVKVDLGPVNADLRFDGTITGTYEGDPGALRFTTTGAQGGGTVKGLGFSRSLSADALADQVFGHDVTGQAVCDAAGTAVLTLPNAALTLTKQG